MYVKVFCHCLLMIACLLKGEEGGAAAQQPHTEPSDSEEQTGVQCFGLRSSSFFPALRLRFAALRLCFAALHLCFFAAFQEGAALLKDVGKGLDRLCSEHGNARLSEVGNALEDRGSGQMTASVEDTAVLVNAFRQRALRACRPLCESSRHRYIAASLGISKDDQR